MSFKVKITQGTGHAEMDADFEQGEGFPRFLEFDSEAERRAYIKGVNDAYEAMDGYVDAWISVDSVKE